MITLKHYRDVLSFWYIYLKYFRVHSLVGALSVACRCPHRLWRFSAVVALSSGTAFVYDVPALPGMLLTLALTVAVWACRVDRMTSSVI